MQTHRKGIKKRVYKVGDIIRIPKIKRINTGLTFTYSKFFRRFQINSVTKELISGVYLDDK